jgi:signal transduction histidine kinase
VRARRDHRDAVKATTAGDRVIVRARAHGDAAVIEVADEGVGIPADALPRIFDRFSREPHRDGGTGLGLPIAHAIVEAHGGSIAVTTSLGRGTTVALRLPGYAERSVWGVPGDDRQAVG